MSNKHEEGKDQGEVVDPAWHLSLVGTRRSSNDTENSYMGVVLYSRLFERMSLHRLLAPPVNDRREYLFFSSLRGHGRKLPKTLDQASYQEAKGWR